MVGIGFLDVFLDPTVEPVKPMCVTLGSDQNSEFYRGVNFCENVKNDEKTSFSAKNFKFMIGIGLFDVFLYPSVEPVKIMVATLGSDLNSEFYRGVNFCEYVKNDEKTSLPAKNFKFMIGIGLFNVFLYPTVEPVKPMCVTLGSHQNSEFYRGVNFCEIVKNDEETCFSAKNFKFMIGIGLFDVFLDPTVEPVKTMCINLGSDQNSEFYRGVNFFENVKNYEKTSFSAKNFKFMIGIRLFNVFLYPTVESVKNMCANFGSDQNSEFYSGVNYFENVKNDKKTSF